MTSQHTNIGTAARFRLDEHKTNRTSKPKSVLGFQKDDRLGQKTETVQKP